MSIMKFLFVYVEYSLQFIERRFQNYDFIYNLKQSCKQTKRSGPNPKTQA